MNKSMRAMPPALMLSVLGGCGHSPSAEKPRFDLKTLAYASPAEVDRVFGKPTGGNVIEEPYTDQMPGEFRDYSYAPENKQVLVRFFRDKCVMIQIHLPRSYAIASEAVNCMGFDTAGKPPKFVSIMSTSWDGNFGETAYKEVTAHKDSLDGSGEFSIVQIELP